MKRHFIVLMHYNLTRLYLIAYMTAWVRSDTSSLFNIWLTWVLTVFSLTYSASPISLLDLPLTISFNTSISLADKTFLSWGMSPVLSMTFKILGWMTFSPCMTSLIDATSSSASISLMMYPSACAWNTGRMYSSLV